MDEATNKAEYEAWKRERGRAWVSQRDCFQDGFLAGVEHVRGEILDRNGDLRAELKFAKHQRDEAIQGETEALAKLAKLLAAACGALEMMSWALDLLDMYDSRLAKLDGPEYVYTPVHVAGKVKAKQQHDALRTAVKEADGGNPNTA